MKTLIGYFDKFSIKNEFGVLQIRFNKAEYRTTEGVVAYQFGNAIYIARYSGDKEQVKVISTNYTVTVATFDELVEMHKVM